MTFWINAPAIKFVTGSKGLFTWRSGGPQVGEVTRLGEVPQVGEVIVCPYNLSFLFDNIYQEP